MHAVHTVLPSEVVTYPAEQLVHAKEALEDAYFPAGHSVQLVARPSTGL